MNREKKVCFPGVKDGDTFTVANMEFIKFPANEQGTPVVLRSIAFRSKFGANNDLRGSDVLKRMEEEILPEIIEELGEENVLSFRTDLTALDGLKPYEDLESRISLCTVDFYRKNVAVFDRYKMDFWWWLATPESAMPHDAPWYTLCVAPSGCVISRNCRSDDIGVRPFLIFESSIFESCEE